ncbi:MAG: hypothetical protein EPN72_11050 [Nevskiaceae bacterium]|nr:MAG: hypothetical protein EPN63_06060 [Nevskiaceae bacterium]TBR72266.1 MAG: hypothetical protein EPN72_11050 [Nevskiaceae bacterium]
MAENANDAILNLLGPVLKQVEPEKMPALVAVLERAVGAYYQSVASQSQDAKLRKLLRDSKENEDANAATIERLHDGAVEEGKKLLERFPELMTLLDRAFANLSPAQRLRATAEAEKVGADLYRQFAGGVGDNAAARADLLGCADRELKNADAVQQASHYV